MTTEWSPSPSAVERSVAPENMTPTKKKSNNKVILLIRMHQHVKTSLNSEEFGF